MVHSSAETVVAQAYADLSASVKSEFDRKMCKALLDAARGTGQNSEDTLSNFANPHCRDARGAGGHLRNLHLARRSLPPVSRAACSQQRR